MNWVKITLIRYLSHYKTLLKNVFSIIGFIWLIIEVLDYGYPDIATTIIKPFYLYIFIFGAVVGILFSCPKYSVTYLIKEMDISITIRIGDFFKAKGTKIIGSNTTFDTDLNFISSASIQGQFTRKYFSQNLSGLDTLINESLKAQPFEKINKKIGKNQLYKMGTVAKVVSGSEIGYFVAIANINDHGTANGSFNDLMEALPSLWNYISERGNLDDLIVPILGTGFTRIVENRSRIIKEIIRSFIAATRSSKFANSLTVTIHPNDYIKNSIDLESLSEFLSCQCNHLNDGKHLGIGTPE